ncbi:hypothetical protein DXY22_02632 [Bacillus subtilis]|nr:hypothetical protein [Bacillus subtilis]QHM84559.1 hypothetical protein DXY22_02632 [Bacillus subtilis]
MCCRLSNEGKQIYEEYEEYEELKKKTIKVILRKNCSIRIIDQKFEDDSLDQFYKEVARFLFERTLKKKKRIDNQGNCGM